MKNKYLPFIFSRYIIYCIQFINTFLLAINLSTYYFGVWAFVQLIVSYFSLIDFGIPSTFNTLAAIYLKKRKYTSIQFKASLTLITILSLLFVILYFLVFNYFSIDFGNKYRFSEYAVYSLILVVLSLYNRLFMNLFRLTSQLNEITFYQAIIPIAILVICIIDKNSSVQHLLIGMILANVLSLLVFIFRVPFKLGFTITKRRLIDIQKTGLSFFLYNTSFYFILFTTRSIYGRYSTVNEFGIFNFSVSMSAAVELIFSSIGFLIFPNVISKFSELNEEKTLIYLKNIREKYIPFVSMLSYLAIAFYPLVLVFLPKYSDSITTFNLLILSKLILSLLFGIPEIIMSKRKENLLAMSALTILILNVLLGYVFARYFNQTLYLIILATTITYSVYILIIYLILKRNIFNIDAPLLFSNKNEFIAYILPLIVTFIISIFHPRLLSIIPFIVYFTLNRRNVSKLKNFKSFYQ